MAATSRVSKSVGKAETEAARKALTTAMNFIFVSVRLVRLDGLVT